MSITSTSRQPHCWNIYHIQHIYVYILLFLIMYMLKAKSMKMKPHISFVVLKMSILTELVMTGFSFNHFTITTIRGSFKLNILYLHQTHIRRKTVDLFHEHLRSILLNCKFYYLQNREYLQQHPIYWRCNTYARQMICHGVCKAITWTD